MYKDLIRHKLQYLFSFWLLNYGLNTRRELLGGNEHVRYEAFAKFELKVQTFYVWKDAFTFQVEKSKCSNKASISEIIKKQSQ